MTEDTRPRVLVVDDEDKVRASLVRFLERNGYEAVPAPDGDAALAALSARQFDAMLCDIRMPGMSGVDLLPRAIAADPDLAIIMLTGVGEPSSAIACLRVGAVDYLIKPVELEELQHSLQYALRKRELELDRRQMEQWLAREVAEKTREVEQQRRQVEALALSVLIALVDALEPRDRDGRTHSMRVSNLAAHVAAELGVDAENADAIQTAARIHDIGRVALLDEGLRRMSAKTGDADSPALAVRILAPLQRFPVVTEAVAFQQEKWDGTGRPAGLEGEAIPLGARIIAAANHCDEATHGTDGLPLPGADAGPVLRALAGTALDPAVVDALVTVLRRRA